MYQYIKPVHPQTTAVDAALAAVLFGICFYLSSSSVAIGEENGLGNVYVNHTCIAGLNASSGSHCEEPDLAALIATVATLSRVFDVPGLGVRRVHLAALFLSAAVAVAALRLFRWLNRPVYIVKAPRPPRATRGQKAQEYPPPFPNGWFMAIMSHDLRPGDVRELNICGRQMVLSRNRRGQVSALHAICPHLGANLGVGASYSPERDCLRCCFHGWEFDAEGNCVFVEGCDVVPPRSNLRAYPVVERNACIFIWVDAEERPPQWDVPEWPPAKEQWTCVGRTYCHVNAHAQELPENGPDSAHLNVLHRDFVWDRITPAVSHVWEAAWAPNPDEPHRTRIALSQAFVLFGRELPGTRVNARISQIGPGIVQLCLDTLLGPVVAYEFVTPLLTTTQMVQHVMFASPRVPRIIGGFALWALEGQFSRDVPIWEAKRYLPKPLLSKADGPISAFRRWYSQFYSQGSLSFPDALAKESMMDF